MFTANSSKNTQDDCQPTKESICYNLPLHTHNKDHFDHRQILILASSTHTERILNRDKKQTEQNLQKSNQKLLQYKISTSKKIPNFPSYKFKNRNIHFISKL